MGVMVLAGMNVNSLALEEEESKADTEALQKSMAWVAVVRFLADCLPQAGFAFHFAHFKQLEGHTLYLVYVSVAFSLLIAFKSCCSAAPLLCSRESPPSKQVHPEASS